jgi:hypothetical protein
MKKNNSHKLVMLAYFGAALSYALLFYVHYQENKQD